MQTIDILREVATVETLIKTIKPDDSSTQVRKAMGENQLNITFEMNEFVVFKINDYCNVFGEKFQLFELPQVTKGSQYYFKYSMVLKNSFFVLHNYQYLFYDNTNQLRESDFSLMGNAETFVDLLISNANRVGSGWVKGEVQSTVYKVLDFSKESCYNILARLAEEFETEFTIIGKTIHLIKKQNDTGKIFKVGKLKGLYEITRTNIDSTSLITRLYAYGSERNLPPDYFSNRIRFPGEYDLCLVSNLKAKVISVPTVSKSFNFSFTPASSALATGLNIQSRAAGSSDPWVDDIGSPDSPRNLTLADGSWEFRFVTIATGACSGATSPIIAIDSSIIIPQWENQPIPYLENNVSTYGVIEHTEIFDDIYPTRTGKVTSVDVSDVYKFTDTSIDFNLNNYLLPGIAPKIVFNTGQLAGYEFEVSAYNHGTKEVRILKNKDERVLDIPSEYFKPAIGDEYVLVDIRLPQEYIYAAETRLKDKAQAMLNDLSVPQVSYQVVFDPVYIKTNSLSLNPNDLVWIVDAQLNLERKIRILSVTRGIVNEYECQVELSDIAQASTLSRVINTAAATGRDVTGVQSDLQNRSILNNNVIGDLKVIQGTIVMSDIPTTSSTVGFEQLYIETATGKIFKKV